MKLFEESQECDCCGREFSGEGATLFSLPNREGYRRQLDICAICYDWIVEQGAERPAPYTFTCS